MDRAFRPDKPAPRWEPLNFVHKRDITKKKPEDIQIFGLCFILR